VFRIPSGSLCGCTTSSIHGELSFVLPFGRASRGAGAPFGALPNMS
jgi:hypothetical protein